MGQDTEQVKEKINNYFSEIYDDLDRLWDIVSEYKTNRSDRLLALQELKLDIIPLEKYIQEKIKNKL